MSETEKTKNNEVITEESVDDILAGILNPDGTFNDDFNGLFAKYVGGGVNTAPVPDVDLSDRSDESIPKERIEYDSGEFIPSVESTADERIAEKIPQNIRNIYNDASSDAQRPEFTSTGDVRYPTMGVGASEQRVVFDADWEEKAKQEAARLERVRQDRMLRGDSAYARTFVAGGMYMPQRNPYVNVPDTNPLYVDPLSRDADFEGAGEASEYYNSNKKPFFPEGFSAAPRSSFAAGGKTEYLKSSRQTSGTAIGGNPLRMPVNTDADWLKVEEKPDKKKKKLSFSKKRKAASLPVQKEPDIDVTEKTPEAENFSDDIPEQQMRVPAFSEEELSEVKDETRDLRSTVAEIVDKYNKRNEEEARKKLEEETRLEELRREEELRERRRQEEIRLLKKSMSPELCEAIDSEEEAPSFAEYDDFSTVTSDEKPNASEKIFGIVFDPAIIDGADYMEQLNVNSSENQFFEADKKEAPKMKGKKNKGKKKSAKTDERKFK
ncbi:MAG: hypothetical protein IKL10_11130 [Clostridia bacterium]|nr:hypothetical protein [Clostridia bacterium]